MDDATGEELMHSAKKAEFLPLPLKKIASTNFRDENDQNAINRVFEKSTEKHGRLLEPHQVCFFGEATLDVEEGDQLVEGVEFEKSQFIDEGKPFQNKS